LAIGRNGQNVRLAAHLTGWKLDLVGDKKNKTEIITDESTARAEEELVKSEDKPAD